MNQFTRIALTTLALIALAAPFAWPASNLSDTHHWAWSENAGWLNGKPTHGGVTVHATHLSGYAWAENVGWVKLGCDAGGPYANASASDWGVNRDLFGDLSGCAWSENVGWINFAPTHGGVSIDEFAGDLSGFAWSENLGWIHLQGTAPVYKAQLVVPQLPSTESTDPEASTWISDQTVEAEWSGATGNDLGLGYSFLFDTSTSTEPDQIIDLAHTSDPHQTTSVSLADGDSHYFHLRSCDPVGNCGATLHLGPFWVDATPPQVALVNTVADTGDGWLEPNEGTRASITQLAVTFDEEVEDPAGDEEADDVTNPANYRLVAAGADGVVTTTSCAAGVTGDDQALVVNQALYDQPSSTSRLLTNGGAALTEGRYRLLTCGSTTIRDRADNALDGDGNGTGGDDHLIDFMVEVTNLLTNPNLDQSLTPWIASSPAEVVHDGDDAGGAPTSGSVEILNLTGTGATFSASQCVTLAGLGWTHASGRATISSGLGEAPVVKAQVDWYDAALCGGNIISTGETAALTGDTSDAWLPFAGWLLPPGGAVSAMVRFVAEAGTSPDFEASLDDLVFYEIDMLFADGFESGDTSMW